MNRRRHKYVVMALVNGAVQQVSNVKFWSRGVANRWRDDYARQHPQSRPYVAEVST
jgi:hypothetical protein